MLVGLKGTLEKIAVHVPLISFFYMFLGGKLINKVLDCNMDKKRMILKVIFISCPVFLIQKGFAFSLELQ